MNRLYDWIGSQPFRSFQLRLFLYLFLIGSIPVFVALTFFYLHSSERSESEWRGLVAKKHDQVQRRLEREMRELEYMYSVWLQNDAVGQLMRASRDGRDMGESARMAIDSISATAAFQLEYRRNVSDLCFTFDRSGSFCVVGNPYDYESRTARVPANRNDFFVQEEGRNTVSWVGPIYDPVNLVIVGYMKIIVDMSRVLDDVRHDQLLSDLVLWDPATDSVLFESGRRDPATSRSPVSFLSEKNAFLRSENGVFLSQRPVAIPGQSWMSYVEVPNTDIRSLQMTLRNTVLVFFAILLAVSVISSLVFSKLFSRPLHLLRQLMKRAESGDLKAYWTYGSIREIDELGNSYNQMLNRLEETIKQVKQEESLKKEAEIEALQYQLNPHFLYNTLNTIKWVAKIHKTPQISDAVSALVRLLQASLGKKGDFISLKEEVGLIQDYMAIQSFRYGDNVAIRYDIDPLASVCLVPKMVLQPLVENALIHGLENSVKNGEISIHARLDRDMLVCEVQDNGKGMADPEAVMGMQPRGHSAKERMSGIGLSNIREKIKLYYGPDYKMHVISKPNQGTTVRLSLPIHRNEES
ncbi:sensor histidine kinase [Paenibacillus hemerocallicola]|jgi:sensor histidine kinase YesM|uniref:histidine kinase n=1 Tax=Paenibacillus hemerocallicola TaxID=1172614 RepID=A0A5C4T309_9BACL|nr:sensor histidine kinase [Paenibacillus hemerocallicola]TNJ63120.1 sensor histidine kinase [Paenibacillus hemerocallicola]